ncbi:MAG TPA: holo-ACP synthase [bacterium]|nr:holo-ACP synthase [bacterium]HPN30618.1 holo-ACP synthase [bacterium]
MIAGIGIDIIRIQRIIDGYNNFGEIFLKKIFTDKEIEYCLGFHMKFESFAGKFSVKEAFMKAIGAGIRQGVWFKDIEILNYETQKPYINVYRKAKELYVKMGSPDIHISISHTDDNAAAVVVLEK